MLTKYTPLLKTAGRITAILSFVMLFSLQLVAEDNAAFHIECPDDVTIYCDDDIYDLSPYGWAYVYGYGDPYPADDPSVHYNLNSCGVGTITRTWTAYDYSGYPYSCTQVIYVISYNNFDGSDIHWPHDYMTHECNPHLDPDYLPYPYNYPTYYDEDCSMIMVGYDDWVFEYSPDCIKILRKWKVIDWCQYHPNNPYSGGIWEHTQVIKVKPPGKPDIWCIPDVTVSANADCSGAYVQLDKVTAISACGNPVPVTNNSPYANNYHGGDASGFYPIGTTKVIFTADDGCGKKAKCHVYITVKDLKKPTPVCINGLTANLMVNPDGYYIDIEGEWFDAGSYDNCTPAYYLDFDVEPKRFTCEELGENNVKVYVTDAYGNTQYCNTYVIIQDNMGMCPPPDSTSYPVSGIVYDEAGDPLSDVLVRLQASGYEIHSLTTEDGSYLFPAVLNGEDYLIIPDVDNSFRDGLTTFDILQIAKYIVGLEDFENSYDYLAADADMSGDVDVLDLTELRNLLLYNTDELGHGHSWRFLPGYMDIEGMDNPLEHQIPGLIELIDLAGSVTDMNFIGVKLGDLDNSLNEDRDLAQVEIAVADEIYKAGSDVNIPFTLTEDRLVEGYQVAIQVQPQYLSSLVVEDYNGQPMNPTLYRYDEDRGELLISWVKPGGIALDATTPLFSLSMDIRNTIRTDELISFNAQKLNPEVYSSDGTEMLLLKLQDATDGPGEEIVKQLNVNVFPNPTAGNLHVRIDDATNDGAGIKRITMTSLSGVPILDVETSAPYMVIEKNNLPPAGMYLLEVTVNGEKIIKKVMIQ